MGETKLREAAHRKRCRKRLFQALSLVALLLVTLRPSRSQNASIPLSAQPVASLGDSLKRAASTNAQLHILYVHGIADPGPGYSDSEDLRISICKFLRDCTTTEGTLDGKREYADKDKFALDKPTPQLSYLGELIWKSRQNGSPSEGWNASAPFVDHWKLERVHASPIYVDEINWWPLVFAAKCRQIIAKDAALVGPNKTYIDKCASLQPDPANPGRFLSYPWIEASDAQQLKAMPSRAALINRSLKAYVLDWGFSDAVLAIGQMRPYLMEGIQELILKSVNVAADGSRGDAVEPDPNQEFVIVSHSLGSYLMFEALDVDLSDSNTSTPQLWKQRFEKVLGQTSIVYFLANQLRLLELANLDNSTGSNMVKHLNAWGQIRMNHLKSLTPSTATDFRPRIVAWSDPSDLLSWNVPDLDMVIVKNLFAKNSIHWFWLLESPTKAHGNYDKNKHVIRLMLKQTDAGSQAP
jgi:hypothetical protein